MRKLLRRSSLPLLDVCVIGLHPHFPQMLNVDDITPKLNSSHPWDEFTGMLLLTYFPDPVRAPPKSSSSTTQSVALPAPPPMIPQKPSAAPSAASTSTNPTKPAPSACSTTFLTKPPIFSAAATKSSTSGDPSSPFVKTL